MRILATALLVVLALVTGLAGSASAQDADGAKDHPAVPRFPGTSLESDNHNDFGAHDFQLKDGAQQHVEGRFWALSYQKQEGQKTPGPLEVARNYGNQFKKHGGVVLLEQVEAGGGTATMKMPAGKGELWLQIDISNNGESLMFHIVESAPMEQKVEVSADELAKDLAATGHVAVYGILFETGKDTLTAASEPVLGEIQKLLAGDATLRLRIEGHTDDRGSKPANLALSKKRAEAVKKWLAGKKVDAARLEAVGLGDTKPVGDNATEDGRARNRRVELVKR